MWERTMSIACLAAGVIELVFVSGEAVRSGNEHALFAWTIAGAVLLCASGIFAIAVAIREGK